VTGDVSRNDADRAGATRDDDGITALRWRPPQREIAALPRLASGIGSTSRRQHRRNLRLLLLLTGASPFATRRGA
jgi:hypothetical protein